MNNKTRLIGPPETGPWVRVKGKGIDLHIRCDDKTDAEIIRLSLEACERRRYGCAILQYEKGSK